MEGSEARKKSGSSELVRESVEEDDDEEELEPGAEFSGELEGSVEVAESEEVEEVAESEEIRGPSGETKTFGKSPKSIPQIMMRPQDA